MTTALTSLLAQLRDADIRLALADGERLSVSAPKGALTPALRAELEQHKDALKDHLRQVSVVRASADAGVVPMARREHMPLSHTQQRLWFMKQLDPSSAAYNVPVAFRLRGRLDVAALELSLADLMARHESLRTRFVSVDGVPRCIVEPTVAWPLEGVDLTAVGPNERESVAMQRLVELGRRPIDATRCPLMHSQLLRLAADEHVFSVVLDHIVTDGVSMALLLTDLQTLYAAHVDGRQADLEPLVVQYLDYADWHQRWLAGGALDEQLDYWRRQLRAPLPVLQLPTDRPRPPVQTSRGGRVSMAIDPALAEGLRELGRREGTTLFMTLLAAFQALLHRYTSQDDICVGSVVANRGRHEVQRVVGFFANNLVLRGDLSGQPTVRELLARVREIAARAYANQDTPFDVLVETLAPPRALDHPPLFQVMFVLHTMRMRRLEMPGLVGEGIEVPLSTARFDLSVDVFDLPGEMGAFFEYNADLFDAATVERMVGHFRMLLEGFVARPDARIAELPMLMATERSRLLVDFNRTTAPLPSMPMHRLFEAQAARTPAAVAVCGEGGSLSYAELNARANRIARRLRQLGTGRGTRVALCMERSVDLVAALLAIHKSQAAYVPLDPGFPTDRLAYMLEDSGAGVLLTSDDADEGLESTAAVQRLDLTADAAWRTLADADLEEGAQLEEPAYVIYTSGSTGRPKGVVVSHGALVNFLESMRAAPGLVADDVLAAVTTISFDIAGLELYLPLIVGARVELVSRDDAADGAALAQRVSACRATVLQATPATWRMLIDAGWPGDPALRALCGGEALPDDLARALVSRTGQLWNLYGPTETTIWSTVERIVDAPVPVSIGRPIANTRVYVVDGTGEPVPIGVPGEIWIGGAGVALGYHERPELTTQRFVPDRFDLQPDARAYRTGDLGRWRDDGRLEHLGRIDTQVKVRGFRIELGEIESLLEAHPSVARAVVAARDAAPGDVRLVAYVVFRAGEDLTASEVRRYLKRDLPDYMVPSVVIAVDAIPLTPNGKTDRAALPDPFAAGRANRRSDSAAEPPAAGMEQRIAAIWRDVLQIDAVGANDNFFELGGHSLLSLRVASAVEKETGWRMDPRSLFFQSLREVAAAAEREAVQA